VTVALDLQPLIVSNAKMELIWMTVDVFMSVLLQKFPIPSLDNVWHSAVLVLF
jgi:hypothetical protein